MINSTGNQLGISDSISGSMLYLGLPDPYYYKRVTLMELKRYEPRHLDAIAEEQAHRQRMDAEHMQALNHQPLSNSDFEISLA